MKQSLQQPRADIHIAKLKLFKGIIVQRKICVLEIFKQQHKTKHVACRAIQGHTPQIRLSDVLGTNAAWRHVQSHNCGKPNFGFVRLYSELDIFKIVFNHLLLTISSTLVVKQLTSWYLIRDWMGDHFRVHFEYLTGIHPSQSQECLIPIFLQGVQK